MKHRKGESPVTFPCASYAAPCEDRTWRSLVPRILGSHSLEKPHATPRYCRHHLQPSNSYPHAIMKKAIRRVLGTARTNPNLSRFTDSPSTVPPTSFSMSTSSHSSLDDSSYSQPLPDWPFELDRGYTPLQVLETKILLQRKGLPLEVIDTILDFAEYWALVSTTAQYAEERVAHSSYQNNRLGYLLYLRTKPLPGEFKPEPAIGGGASEGVTTGCLVGREP